MLHLLVEPIFLYENRLENNTINGEVLWGSLKYFQI